MIELYNAILAKDFSTVKALLADGQSPNVQFEDSGDSPLTLAAEKGDVAICKILLERGADPNFRKTIEPPLVTAAGQGFYNIVALLLESGANVDYSDEDRGSALLSAAAGGHVRIVRLLLKAGANPKLKDRSGSTAVRVAAENSHWDIVDVLLPFSASSERRSIERRRAFALQIVSEEDALKFGHAAERNNISTIEAMLAKGFPINGCPSDGMTALMWAANRGHRELVKLLLDHGAIIARQTVEGETALGWAAMNGQLEMVNLLYPLASPSDQKRAVKHIAFLKKLPWQYPDAEKWEPPAIAKKSGSKK